MGRKVSFCCVCRICVDWFSICPGVCNFALVKILGNQQTISLVFSQKFSQIQKPHRHYFDCDLHCKSATTQTQIAESALDSTIPQNLARKVKSVESTLDSAKQNLKSFLLRLAFAKRRIFSPQPTLIHQITAKIPPKISQFWFCKCQKTCIFCLWVTAIKDIFLR